MELDPEKYISVNEKDISPDSFRGVIENFILQEGTDYGPVEYSLEEKVAMVIQQIREKEACLVFDRENEMCTVVLSSL